ncbi:hypothetical protein PoB_004365500 [Plakobranchus ocellatus]|uniref:Uncharacterized protein n=1 Tax=Plakobranchus ocellatus TaxID=259542 RepID=A0AAV4BC91_9GAST|nr:hypothetical protein PoB_004365500 [Plakobranchus ocellatus]
MGIIENTGEQIRCRILTECRIYDNNAESKAQKGPNNHLRHLYSIKKGGSSSGRAVGYQVRAPKFESQSGPSQFFNAPLRPPSTRWVARSLKPRRK